MRLILNVFCCLINIMLILKTQAQQKEINIARELEKMGRFSMAIQHYKKAEVREKYLAEEERVDLYKSLIFCKDKIKDYKNTEKYFKKIEKLQSLDDSLMIKYSEILRTTGNYTKATELYKKVISRQSDKELIASMQYTLDWYNKNKKLEQPYIVSKTNIDVQGLSMGVAEYKNGIIIGMPRTTEGLTYYNLGFCAKKDSVTFSKPELLSKNVTSKYHEGYPVVDKENKILYFTSNSLKKVKIKQKEENNKNIINRLKIYKSKLENGTWGDKEELSFNGLDYDCLHPSLSKDGKTMYFTSNMPGGNGGYDIYKVEKTNKGWTEPQNLGSRINTMGDEMNPFIYENTLYFSSRGLFGFGGIDIFKINILDEKSYPENLGIPVNSSYDDFAFTINNKKTGYISSNRSSKEVEDLIYSYVFHPMNVVVDKESGETVEDIDVIISKKVQDSWEEIYVARTNTVGEWIFDFKKGEDYKITFDNSYRHSKEFIIKSKGDRVADLEKLKRVELQRIYIDGYVIDEETQEGIEGVKEILYEKNELGELEEVDSTFTDEEGYWRFDVEKNKEYEVEIDMIDYELTRIEVAPIEDNYLEKRTYTTKLKTKLNKDNEKILDVKDILFELNSANISNDSYSILNQVVEYLKANPYTKLEINAHTDCTGEKELNLQLSKKRALVCANYIINKIGGKSFRVKHKGLGESDPIHPCEEQVNNPKLAAKNRRVEFKLVR